MSILNCHILRRQKITFLFVSRKFIPAFIGSHFWTLSWSVWPTVHTLTPYFFKIHFNIVVYSKSVLPLKIFLLKSYIFNSPYQLHFLPNFIFDFITLITCGDTVFTSYEVLHYIFSSIFILFPCSYIWNIKSFPQHAFVKHRLDETKIHIHLRQEKLWNWIFSIPCSKGKAVPLHAMEALGGRGGIAPTHSRPRH
jgi:hypothetical protein